jgi:predicted dehydrogenase
MDNVRIGIVGSGDMGRKYAHCLRDHNTGSDLVGVTLGTRAPKLAEDFEAELYPDYEAMLHSDKVDAVLLATIHKLHAEQVIAAAEHGKHVLVEKPMMTNVADCDVMIAACEDAGVTLSVIQTLRFIGGFARASRLIDEGTIGDVRMVHFTSLWTYGEPDKLWTAEFENGGEILDRAAHSFDMLRFLTRDEPVRLFATVNSYDVEAWRSQNAMAQVQFSRGATAQLWMGHELPEPGFPHSKDFVRVWGSKGMLDIEHHGKLRVSTDGEWRDVWEEPEIDVDDRYAPERLEACFTQTQDFIDCLREGRPPSVTGEDGRAAIEMIEACHFSNLTGNAVDLPLPRSAGGLQFDGATVDRSMIPG